MSEKTILITGCSSGIGYAAAHGLKSRGWRVFASCRRHEDCVRLREEGLESYRLDYDDESSIANGLKTVLEKTGGRLDALYNNGAYTQPGALEDLSSDLLRAQFQSNVFGVHELTRRVIPVMRRQGHGRIVNCSSVLGLVAAPFRGAYCASKFALEGMTDALRMELAGSGIHVVLIEPGPIRSGFIAHALERIEGTVDIEPSAHRDEYQRQLAQYADGGQGGRFRLGPEAVVAKLVLALESPKPRARYAVTVPARAVTLMRRFLPTSLLDRVMMKQ